MTTLLAEGLEFESAYCTSPAILYAAQYVAGGLALQLVSDDGIGEPLATLSVWVEGVSDSLAFNEFVVKSYSENEGVDDWLMEANLAQPTGRYVFFGDVGGAIFRLNEALSATLKGTQQ